MKRVLLVGLEYSGPTLDNVIIETKGLCRREISQVHSASPLYNYDVVIINPKSYSHFIFGKETEFSDSPNELFDLKKKNNDFDLDTIFDYHDRNAEMNAAIDNGTCVILLAAIDKYTNFFGKRSVYLGYLSKTPEDILKQATIYQKESTRLKINQEEGIIFSQYFEQLMKDGWNLCWVPTNDVNIKPLALTPENYHLGTQLTTKESTIWILTPPPTTDSVQKLLECSLQIDNPKDIASTYHGIFLSHNSEDKPFVRQLRSSLKDKGVTNVWIDEAEILLGDSLLRKIQEGIDKTEYFGVVLSPNSVSSEWVQRELEQAMSYEISSKTVKVLPLLYKPCDLPGFLRGKMYADFTSKDKYDNSIDKILRRLRR